MKKNKKPQGFRVAPLSLEEIRKQAQAVRDIFQVSLDSTESKFPVVEAVEFLYAHDIIQLEIVDDDDMPTIAAEVIPTSPIPILRISDSVYARACDGSNFDRFTLAHEIGHLFLHSNQPIPLQRLKTPVVPDHGFHEDSEWQANSFAGELLVDMRYMRDICKTPLELSHKFNVSIQVAKIQWEKR